MTWKKKEEEKEEVRSADARIWKADRKTSDERNSQCHSSPNLRLYNNHAQAATAPTASPPTSAAIFGAAPVGTAVVAAAAVSEAAVGASVDELAAVEVTTAAFTSSGFKVPHSLQLFEPGVALRHSANS